MGTTKGGGHVTANACEFGTARAELLDAQVEQPAASAAAKLLTSLFSDAGDVVVATEELEPVIDECPVCCGEITISADEYEPGQTYLHDDCSRELDEQINAQMEAYWS